MNTADLHPLAADYMKRLKKAARHLPRSRRDELLGEIETHLRESLPPDAPEAEARKAIGRLGEPEQIAAEAASPAEVRVGTNEWLAVVLLAFGGALMPPVGLAIGLCLLWKSNAWTVREKVIGTVVIPIGETLAMVVLFLGPLTMHLLSKHEAVALAILVGYVLLPLVIVVYLMKRARGRQTPGDRDSLPSSQAANHLELGKAS